MQSSRKIQIGVIGGRNVSDHHLKQAEAVGKLLAEKGAVVVCGGLGGVMEAACWGAKSANGTTVGILPTGKAADANPFVDIVIPTDLGVARNALVVNASQGVIAVGGSYGTLSEIAFALQRGIPVASIGSWDVDTSVFQSEGPADAVSYIFNQISKLSE